MYITKDSKSEAFAVPELSLGTEEWPAFNRMTTASHSHQS